MAQPADLDPAGLNERFARLMKGSPFSGYIGRAMDADAIEVKLSIHAYVWENIPWEELTGDLDAVLKKTIDKVSASLKDYLARLAK